MTPLDGHDHGIEKTDWACNLCNSGQYRTVWTIRGFPVVQCSQCQLIAAIADVSVDDLNRLYGEEFYSGMDNEDGYGYPDYASESSTMLKSMSRQLDKIEALLGRPGRILDIGCAMGFFLDHARARGWEVEGCEVSEFAAIEAGKRLNIPVRVGEFDGAAWEPESFDAVTMWDTIEHCRDPLSALRSAERVLKPGGVLALSTGDIGSLSARMWGRRWRLLQVPLHLYYFSTHTMRDALHAAGLETVRIYHPGKFFSLGYCGFMLSTLFRNPLCRMAGSVLQKAPFSKLQVYLNFWDIVTAVAKKPQSPL